MESSKLELIFKSIITPKATDQSLRLGFNKMCKLDRAAAEAFLKRLCEMSVYRAVRLVQSYPAEIRETFSPFVSNYLSNRLNVAGSIDGTAVLSIVALRNGDLFRAVLPKLSDDCIRDAYLTAESGVACRLTEYMLRFATDAYQLNYTEYFVQFLSRYDYDSGTALAELLTAVMDNDDKFLLSALFEALGAKYLESLYGERLWEELDRFLICGKDTPLLWYRYIDRFFSQQHEDEDYLISGLWYVQLFASGLKDVLPYFKLSAIEALGLRHPFVDNIACEYDCAAPMSWEFVSRFKALIKEMWSNPAELSYFIDIMGEYNPYASVFLDKQQYRILNEVNAADYHQLVELFDQGIDCATIIKLFFRTYLKESLSIENLLGCFSLHGKLEDALKEFEKIQFMGYVVKENEKRKCILSPCEYFVRKFHEFNYSISSLEETLKNDKSIVKKFVNYSITGYRFGSVLINVSMDKEEPNLENWDSILNALEELLDDSQTTKREDKAISKLMDFSVERFISEYDFNLLTRLLSRKTDRFEKIENIFLVSKWNALFRTEDARFPSRFYSELKIYVDNATVFFQNLFDAGIDYKNILSFYLHSIYKVIVPFDRFLSLADRSAMLPVLTKQTFRCCRIESVGDRYLCRLKGVLCSPVCTFESAEDVGKNQIVQARCTDYEFNSGVVTDIIFKRVSNTSSSIRMRGSFFGYIARNASLSKPKEQLIDILCPAEECDPRELAFIIRRMEDAVHIRRTSGASILRLLRAMGDKNPFFVHLDRKISRTYSDYLRNEQQRKRCYTDIASILLNTPTIQEIAEIYLNTSIRFYISVAELRSMIQFRRLDLMEQLDMLFADCGLTKEELEDCFSLWSREKTDSLPAVSPHKWVQDNCSVSPELSASWDALQLDAWAKDQLADDPDSIKAVWREYKRAFSRFLGSQCRSVSRFEMNTFLVGQIKKLVRSSIIPRQNIISLAKETVDRFSYFYHSNLFTDSVYDVFLNAYGANVANRFLEPIQRKEKYQKNRMEDPEYYEFIIQPDQQ